MTDTTDLCCNRCGGTAWKHLLRPNAGGGKVWRNRCQGCGRVSEYIPTREEIAYECQRIRCEQGLTAVDDPQEKFWRHWRDEMCDEEPDDWDAPE